MKTAKPIYYVTSGMHSPETGGPEMLIELAYRLIVEETPFIQNIRNNVITLITPVIEVDGREKQVDTYYFNKKRAPRRCAAAADVLGQVRAARQQPRRHGPVPRADQDRHQRRSSSGTRRSCTTCTRRRPTSTRRPAPARTTTRSTRSPIDEWWLLARERRHGDDQARRARRLDLRLLRRLGAELPVLHRPLAQRDRPLLRSAELRARPVRSAARRHDHQQGMVPAESAAAVHQVGPAQQHQHPGVGAAVLAEPRGQEQGAVSRELLAEEQARGRRRARTARSTRG